MKKFKGTIDIHSKGKNKNGEKEPWDEVSPISQKLSNFCPHAFVFDGVECASMEGFLQSLKYICPKKQRQICALTDLAAKTAGDNGKLWKLEHKVCWRGKIYDRLSPEYRALILRAYRAMYAQNEDFRKALADSRGYKLIHSIGKSDPKETILTEKEFICCLYKCRKTENKANILKIKFDFVRKKLNFLLQNRK